MLFDRAPPKFHQGPIDYPEVASGWEGLYAFCLAFPRKTLQVKIVDDEEYEKKDNFFIELGQPQWLKRGISGEGRRGGYGRNRGPRVGGPRGTREPEL